MIEYMVMAYFCCRWQEA